MSSPLLATKLFIPPTRPNHVLRSRLLQLLNEGLHHKLTLISAPAGFGKTMLISSWLNHLRRTDDDLPKGSTTESLSAPANSVNNIAWLSLDEGDSDLNRFLTYIVAAMQTSLPSLGQGLLDMLQSPQPPSIESMLTALVNDIATLPEPIVLVLDDYHVVEPGPVDQALTFLLEHLPPQAHLIITTREDPSLPLARLRARDQMTEIRAADIRFSSSEAASFLNQAMGLTLSPTQIEALETRTEGWIAGLQMAALSLQRSDDSAGFIHTFTGSHRFVLDYLAEEVLQHQPEDVRKFLLQTSILERLGGPLCDAVTLQQDGNETLENLERANLFVVPLDNRRQWYRYHHLFNEVLQARMREQQPDQISILHQRASDWYEANGQRSDAIQHALAAGNFERAANLVELTWPALHRSDFRSPEVISWLAAVPDELIRARPVLSIGYAWALLNGGDFDNAEIRLQDAELWVAPADELEDDNSKDNASGERVTEIASKKIDVTEMSATEMHVMDEEEFRSLPAEIASARSYLAMARGDVPGTVKYAQRALDVIPEDAHIRRGPSASLLGLAHWAMGNLEAAHQALAEGMANFQAAGNIPFAISGVFGLADIRIAQGRLHAAISDYEKALQLAEKVGEPALAGTADLHLGLSGLYREQGDPNAAEEEMRRSQDLGTQAGQQVYRYRACLARARIKLDQGDLDGALQLFEEAKEYFNYVHIPDFRPVAAIMVRARLAHGQLTEALSWVNERGLSFDDDLSFQSEFEHITLARVLIAQYKNSQENPPIQQALSLLARLLSAAEERQGLGSVIEILILQALVHEAQGDLDMALVRIERSLTLAEPEGYVRIFVDEGQPMKRLLSAAATQGILPEYLAKLLNAFETEKQLRAEKALSSQESQPPVSPTPAPNPSSRIDRTAPTASSSNDALIEPLTQRELEVLELVAQGLSNREISERLFLSVNTVKGHNRVIFGKLQVQRRTEAVARAQALGLV